MNLTIADKKIYDTLFRQKALTEYVVGRTRFSFPYAEVTYTATCIDAVEFTMFDRVICGLLQIDEVLSFTQIADILGLQTVHRPEKGQYIDYGEKEILEVAIESLIDFKMIETGDINHSRCRLTELGKEYASHGMKFLPSEKKSFKIKYDLTDNRHDKASERYGRFGGEIVSDYESELNFSEEEFVKNAAKYQVSEIYNPDRLKNFTDLTLHKKEFYTAEFTVFGINSFTDKSMRYLAFDTEQNVCHSITEMINAEKDIKAILQNKIIGNNVQSKSLVKGKKQTEYEKKAVETQFSLNILLSEKKYDQAFVKSEEFVFSANFINENYFKLSLSDFFVSGKQEYWFILQELDDYVFAELQEIIHKKSDVSDNLFFVTASAIAEKYQDYFNSTAESDARVFYLPSAEVNFPLFIAGSGNTRAAFFPEPLIIESKNGKTISRFQQNYFMKTTVWNSSTTVIFNRFKTTAANKYFEQVKDLYHNRYNYFLEHPSELNKENITQLTGQITRLKVFKNVKKIGYEVKKFQAKAHTNLESLQKSLLSKIEKNSNKFKRD